jgi:hypothetical protein
MQPAATICSLYLYQSSLALAAALSVCGVPEMAGCSKYTAAVASGGQYEIKLWRSAGGGESNS